MLVVVFLSVSAASAPILHQPAGAGHLCTRIGKRTGIRIALGLPGG
jgi:hypothetical protein